MKLKCSFETVNMGEEIILVPVGDGASEVHGVLKMNAEGREIISLLENETTEENIVEILTAKYENDHNILTDYVHNVLNKLRDADLLDE